MHWVRRQPEHTGSCICTMEMLLIRKAFFFPFHGICLSFSQCKRRDPYKKEEKKIQWYWELCLFYINYFCTHAEGGRLGGFLVLGGLVCCLLWVWFWLFVVFFLLIVLIVHRELLKHLWNPINKRIVAGQGSEVSSVTCSQNGTWHWLD